MFTKPVRSLFAAGPAIPQHRHIFHAPTAKPIMRLHVYTERLAAQWREGARIIVIAIIIRVCSRILTLLAADINAIQFIYKSPQTCPGCQLA